MPKFNIGGSVDFKKDGKWADLMGKPREDMLRRFYRGEHLEGVPLCFRYLQCLAGFLLTH